MNPNIEKIYRIAQKPKRLVIGLMSGTSLDGLDIALCSIEGSGTGTKTNLLHFETIPYTDDLKNEIRKVFARRKIDLEDLCLLNPRIALLHAELIKICLDKWNVDPAVIDLVGSHGQTVYHAPEKMHGRKGYGNSTLQIGDGDHLAVATGTITISDFRQKHIAAGGEGAPLAVYGDLLLFGKMGENRILLNIGGIANFTCLPGDPETRKIICTDTGPGNTLMDALVRENFPGKYFDENATIASEGTVNETLLAALKEHIFFQQAFPKTTGVETFNLAYLESARQKSGTQTLSVADTLATLNKFTADTITDAILKCTENEKKFKVYCSGGGMHNPLLVQHLKQQLPGFDFHSTEETGVMPDAKEAMIFALLANECVCGDNHWLGNKKTGMPAVSMGKISFPC